MSHNSFPTKFNIAESGHNLDYEMMGIIQWPQYYPRFANQNKHPYAAVLGSSPFVFSNANVNENPIGILIDQPDQFSPEARRNIFYQSNGLPLELGGFMGTDDENVIASGMHQNLIDTYWTSPLTMYYRDFGPSGIINHRPFAKPTSVLYNVPISSGHKDAINEHPE